MPVLLIRSLPYIVFALVIGTLFYFVFDSGREYERGVWAQREVALNNTIIQEKEAAAKAAREAEDRYQIEIARVINAHNVSVETINHSIDAASRGGLYVTAKPCPAASVPETSTRDGAEQPTAGSGSESAVRLPEEVETGLWDVIRAAEEIKEYYLACRKIVTSSACNITLR